MDTPIWVRLLVAVLTAVGTYFAGIRPARIAARQAEADRDLARQERDDGREQWFIERIEKGVEPQRVRRHLHGALGQPG